MTKGQTIHKRIGKILNKHFKVEDIKIVKNA